MIILGFALRIFGVVLRNVGVVLRFAALAAAPVVAVLAWGAVEDEMDKRKKTAESGTGS